MTLTKQLFIPLAPVLAAIFHFTLQAIGLDSKASIAAAITLLTVIWWVTEALPIQWSHPL
jgi:sodium-dependent dicarboxylate transporter 2/3/5